MGNQRNSKQSEKDSTRYKFNFSTQTHQFCCSYLGIIIQITCFMFIKLVYNYLRKTSLVEGERDELLVGRNIL